MIPGIKRFIQEKYGIRIIKYKGDKYNYLNNEILYDFVKKIESKNINEKQKERIIDKMKDKNKDEVLLSIQSLMLSILENFKDVKEQESINDYLKVNNNIDNVDSLKAVLGIDDNMELLAELLALRDAVDNRLFLVIVALRHQNLLGAVGDTAPQRDVTRLAPHHLDDAAALMRGRGIADAVNCLHSRI